MIPLTKFLMYATSPITYPGALMLDCWLGHHGRTRFQNQSLQRIIGLHTKQLMEENHINEDDGDENYGLSDQQQQVILNAFEKTEKRAESVMIPRKDLFCISADEKVTERLIDNVI